MPGGELAVWVKRRELAIEGRGTAVDSRFNFLNAPDTELLKGIISRRNPGLRDRISLSPLLSRSDAEEIISTISDELTDNLDEDWEPTEHGKRLAEILAQINAAPIVEWP